MKKSFAVVGLGRFGTSVAMTLMDAGAHVLAIDNNPECVKRIASQVTCAVTLNVCDTEALKEVGLETMDGVIVSMGQNLEASAMTIMTSKEMGVPYILAKCTSDEMAKILLKVGADKVVYPEKDTGQNVARKMLFGNFLDYFELSENINVAEFTVKPEWIGKSIRSLNFRKKYKMNVIAIKRGKEVMNEINPDIKLDADCKLIVIVSNDGLKRLME